MNEWMNEWFFFFHIKLVRPCVCPLHALSCKLTGDVKKGVILAVVVRLLLMGEIFWLGIPWYGKIIDQFQIFSIYQLKFQIVCAQSQMTAYLWKPFDRAEHVKLKSFIEFICFEGFWLAWKQKQNVVVFFLQKTSFARVRGTYHPKLLHFWRHPFSRARSSKNFWTTIAGKFNFARTVSAL